MTDDSSLLQRFVQADDQEAFAELVRQKVNLVYSTALRQVGGDDHLARDVSQAVFVALARSASRLQQHATLSGWLYTTTRFLSAKAVRTHRRWRQREQEAQAMRPSDEAGPTEPNWDQLRPVLDAAMHQLNGSDREALLLRYFEGLPFAAVGERCALSENSARMRVERALEKLRGHLAKRGVTSTAAALSLTLGNSAVAAAPAGLAAAASGAALASLAAGGATAGVFSLFLSMSTTKVTAGVLGALFILAAGSATYEARKAQRAETALGLAHQEDAERIRALEGKLAALAARAPGAAAAAPAGPAGSGNEAAHPAAGKSGLATALQMISDPQMEIGAKLQLDDQYAALFKALHLPPDQTAQFQHLLVEKRAALIDGMAAAQEHGVEPNADPKGFYMAVVAAEAPVNAEITTLLGPAGFQQYQDYVQNLPSLTTSHLLQQTLSYTPTPLSDDQAAQLSQILQKNTPNAIPEPFTLLNGDLGVTAFTGSAQALVQGLLSAPQIQALQQQIAQQHQLLMAREQMNNK